MVHFLSEDLKQYLHVIKKKGLILIKYRDWTGSQVTVNINNNDKIILLNLFNTYDIEKVPLEVVKQFKNASGRGLKESKQMVEAFAQYQKWYVNNNH